MAMERERERHTHIHTYIHTCMHACIYIYNITPYIIHVSEYLFINQSIYLFTFLFTHVSRLNLHPVRPSRVMPCLVDFYDCLRAWANPKSIGYPPWRKGNLDCHEPLGDVFPGLPVEPLLVGMVMEVQSNVEGLAKRMRKCPRNFARGLRFGPNAAHRSFDQIYPV